MFFGIPDPTVTPEDKDWIEEAFLWFNQEYTADFLKSVPIIEPTKAFFPTDFQGTEENAEEMIDMICKYMKVDSSRIDIHYFSNRPAYLTEGSSAPAMGTFRETGKNRYSIGLELSLLQDPIGLISTVAHELSHVMLLGDKRLQENDEVLTDLNCIAMGFGIFMCNSIFSFSQSQGPRHQGWQSTSSGYIPLEVATYALAVLINYQGNKTTSWTEHLDPLPQKMFKRNMEYLSKTSDVVKFK